MDPNYSTLRTFLENNAKQFSDKPAFSCLGKTLSFEQLELKSRKFAYWLQQQNGLTPGDRIAIQLPNCLEFPVAAYAVLRAGFVIVNTNPNYTPRETLHQLVDSGAKAIILDEQVLASQREVIGQAEVDYVIETSGASQQTQSATSQFSLDDVLLSVKDNCELYNPQIEPSDLALIQYTGGTTGVSKGACLSHANILANLHQVGERFSAVCQQGKETFVCPLPLYHIYAFTVNLMLGSVLGAHVVLINNPQNPEEFVNSMTDNPFSVFSGINTLFVGLCQYDKFRALDFGGLKLTISGGATLTMDAATKWLELTSCGITEGYGLSETSPVVAFNIPGSEELGTVGPALIDTDIAIRGENNSTVAPAEEGEIVVKGPQVMSGYWMREQESADCFTADGYFKTGDIGKIESSGCLRIVDRLKDMILVSGFNVYPNEIENLLTQHECIAEAAVIGKPCSKSGESVQAYITLTKPTSTEEIQQYCRAQLTAYKIPKNIVIVDSLPKSSVGKILRKSLREQATNSNQNEVST